MTKQIEVLLIHLRGLSVLKMISNTFDVLSLQVISMDNQAKP